MRRFLDLVDASGRHAVECPHCRSRGRVLLGTYEQVDLDLGHVETGVEAWCACPACKGSGIREWAHVGEVER